MIGSWAENGKLDRGRWVRGDKWGRILIGQFDTAKDGGNWLSQGRIVFGSGRWFEGSFKDGENVGYCVWWDAEGRYDKGGKCTGSGKIAEPILQP
ncbi:MAG: hypothetical protein AAGL10_04205 [Pseudomonadota bacterium]